MRAARHAGDGLSAVKRSGGLFLILCVAHGCGSLRDGPRRRVAPPQGMPVAQNEGSGPSGAAGGSSPTSEPPDFSPFLARVSGACAGPTLIQFHPVGFFDIEVRVSLQGNPVRANIALFLRGNGTFGARYEEWEHSPCDGSGFGYVCKIDRRERKDMEGSWRVDASILRLEGLGRARIASTRPASLRLTLESKNVAQDIQGKQAVGWSIASATGDRGITMRDYCSGLAGSTGLKSLAERERRESD